MSRMSPDSCPVPTSSLRNRSLVALSGIASGMVLLMVPAGGIVARNLVFIPFALALLMGIMKSGSG